MAGSDSQRVELKEAQGAELEGRGGEGMAGSDSQRVELKAVQGAELEGRGGDGRLRLAAGGAEGGAGSRVRE